MSGLRDAAQVGRDLNAKQLALDWKLIELRL